MYALLDVDLPIIQSLSPSAAYSSILRNPHVNNIRIFLMKMYVYIQEIDWLLRPINGMNEGLDVSEAHSSSRGCGAEEGDLLGSSS